MTSEMLTFVAAIIGGGAAGAIINSLIQHRKAEKDKADARMYLARVLAFLFEDYAIACAHVLSDGEDNGPDPIEIGSMGPLPNEPNLPQSPAYQWLDPDLLERTFSFPRDIAAVKRGSGHVWQYGDGDDYDTFMRAELSRMGILAAAIAVDLRAKNGIAPRPLVVGEWDVLEYLREKGPKPITARVDSA